MHWHWNGLDQGILLVSISQRSNTLFKSMSSLTEHVLMKYVGLLWLTGCGLMLHIPTFSTICLMLQMKALEFWNSSRVGSNTGASGGGLNTSWESGIFRPHTYATDLQNYSGYGWFVSGVFNLAWLLQHLGDNYSNFFCEFFGGIFTLSKCLLR